MCLDDRIFGATEDSNKHLAVLRVIMLMKLTLHCAVAYVHQRT